MSKAKPTTAPVVRRWRANLGKPAPIPGNYWRGYAPRRSPRWLAGHKRSCWHAFLASNSKSWRSALFIGVPCFKNGVGVPVDPVDSQGTAIHENNGQRLSGGCYCFHQFFFRLGKIDAGAIATEKSRLGDRHLFTLKLACDAHDRDDGIGVFRCCDGFRRRRAAVLRPDQFRMGLAVPAAVGDLERDLAALLKVNATDAR